MPSINISSAQMWLFVPPKGFELVDVQFPPNGKIFSGSWVGDIKKGQTVEINATYRITSTGWGDVEGQLLVQRGGEVTDTIVDIKMADLSVDEEGGTITRRELKPYEAPALPEDFHVTEPVITPWAGYLPNPQKSKKLDETANLSAARTQNHTRGMLTITGGYNCWISENTFTPGETREDVSAPRVWAWVKIYDGNDNFLGEGLTGTDGRFSITVENPGDTGFYVLTMPNTSACHVTKSDGSDYIGRLPANSELYIPSPSDTTFDIGDGYQVVDDPDYKGAWRIYETIANDAYDRGAWDFLANEGPGYVPPEVHVVFPSFLPTGYDTSTHRIHINESYHTKALDVVQHEYGHFIMNMTYGSLPTAGCTQYHKINESWPSELSNCAWLEGWDDFFPLAVQDEPVYEWGDGSYCDLEIPTWGTPGWDDGDCVEGRVAGALNDIFDDRTHDDGYDTFWGGFNDIWDVFYHQADNNFHEFYEAWCERGHDIPGATAAIYQNTIVYGTIYVDTGGWWFEGEPYNPSDTPIQDAVNAGAGEIIVYPGTYTENVNIEGGGHLTIRSLSGNPEDTIVQAANPDWVVFWVHRPYVTISGFTITGATGDGEAGIYLGSSADNCIISNNIVTSNYYGIWVDAPSYVTITDNEVSDNNDMGIFIDCGGGGHTIANNSVSNNRLGIDLYHS